MRKVVAACLLIGVFLLPLVGPFVGSVHALNSAEWVNQATISYQGVQYKENNAEDDNWHFYAANPNNGCQQEIKDFTNPGYDSLKGPYRTQTVTLYKQKAVTGGCSPDGTEDIQLNANPPGYNTAFIWQDDNNIVSADGKKKFSKDASGSFISVTDGSACKDFITVGSDQAHPTLTVRSNTGAGDNASISLRDKYAPNGGSGWAFVRSITSAGDTSINGTDCHESKGVGVTADSAKAAVPGTSVAPGSSTGPGAKDNSCESKGALAWILCPVIKLLDGIFNWLDTQIQALLEVNQDSYTNPKLYQAWSQIRNIAFIVLIPIMLVMVIATALGSEMFSAYTVKKAIPRMVAAILFITLSWYICGFLIGFFNVLGSGVIGLLTSPFKLNGQITLGSLFNPSVGGTGGQLIGGGAALGLGIFALANVEGIVGILALYFLGAVIVIFLAFLVLVIRQMFIIALLLAAPIAILAWIFPGNDKVWKLWWGTFSKLLMMFPLITGLIAVGRIFAYLIGNTPAGGVQGGLLNPLLKITAYIVPYALIPLTFKFAGGAFATLTGMVNDRSRGVFDRMKKSRQKQWSNLGHRAKSGDLLRHREGEDAKSLNARWNKKVQTATLVGSAGLSMNRRERSNRIEAARERREYEEIKELTEKLSEFQPLRKDDDKLWAAYHGNDRASIRKALIDRAPSRFNEDDKKGDLDRAVEEVWAFNHKVGHEKAQLMSVLSNAGTGTGFNYRTDEDGNYTGDDDMNMALLKATGNNASMRGRMLAEMRPMLVQSGRGDIGGGGYAWNMRVLDDLASSYDTATGDFKEIEREVIDPATGRPIYELETDGSYKLNAKGERIKKKIKVKYDFQAAHKDIMQDVLRSNAGAAIAGKVKGVEQLAPIIAENAEAAMTATGPNAVEEAIVELATVQGRQDAANSIAPQNARELRRSTLTHEIEVANINPELRKLLDPVITTYETRVEDVIGPDGKVVYDIKTDDKGNEISREPRKEAKVHAVSSRTKIKLSEAMDQLMDHPVFQEMRTKYGKSALAAAQAQMAASAAQTAGIPPTGTPGTPGVPGAGGVPTPPTITGY